MSSKVNSGTFKPTHLYKLNNIIYIAFISILLCYLPNRVDPNQPAPIASHTWADPEGWTGGPDSLEITKI